VGDVEDLIQLQRVYTSIAFRVEVNCSPSDSEHFDISDTLNRNLCNGLVCCKSVTSMGYMRCCPSISQLVVKEITIIFGRDSSRNIVVATVIVVI